MIPLVAAVAKFHSVLYAASSGVQVRQHWLEVSAFAIALSNAMSAVRPQGLRNGNPAYLDFLTSPPIGGLFFAGFIDLIRPVHETAAEIFQLRGS